MAFGTYDQGADDRGLTTKLWLGCNPDVIRNDPRHGMFFLDDFTSFHTTAAGSQNGRKVVQTTAGTAVEVDDENYGVVAVASSATINQGVSIFWPGVTIAPTAGLNIAFECRVKLETVTTGSQLWAGLTLATDDAVLMAAAAPTPSDYVGLYTPSSLVVSAAGSDGSSASATAGIGTMVAASYHKLGIRVNGEDGVQTFFDGLEVDNSITAASIPEDTTLRLSVANISDGGSTSVASFDWVAVGAF